MHPNGRRTTAGDRTPWRDQGARVRALLSEAETGYRLLFEANPLPMWLFDLDTLRILDVNEAAMDAYGYTREEFVAMSLPDLSVAEDGPKIRAIVGRIAPGAQVVDVYRLRSKAGGIRDVETLAHGFLLGGRRTGLVLAHDISDRMRTARYRALEYEATKVLAEHAKIQEAAPALLRAIGAAGEWDVGELWEVDPAAHVLRWAAGWRRLTAELEEFERESRALRLPTDDGVVGEAVRRRTTAWTQDITEGPNQPRAALAARAELRGAVAVPIVANREMTHVLAFLAKERIEPDEDLLDLITDLGRRVGQAVEREQAIRERRRADEQLWRSFASSPAPMLLSRGPEGRILDANDSFLRLMGYRRDEILGQTTIDLGMWPRSEDREERRRILQAWEPVKAVQFQGRTKSGGRKDLLVYAEPLRVAEEDTLLTTFVDLTELKETQRQLAESQRLASMAQIAAFVAHEVNTPLTNIALLSASARRQSPPDEVLSRLEKIDAQRRLAVAILEDLLTLTRARGVRTAEADLKDVVERALEQVASSRKEGVALRAELPSDPVVVRIDAVRIQHAVANLLRNALQHTDRGSVDLRLDSGGGAVMIEVRDTGHGILPENLPRLFEPFFTTQEAGRGTGLGLAFVKSTVEAHGGRVEVESEPECGAMFRIVLPRRGAPSAG